jgi:hypothetical protein
VALALHLCVRFVLIRCRKVELLRVFIGLEVLGFLSLSYCSHIACCISHLHFALALRFAGHVCFSRLHVTPALRICMLLLICAFACRDYASHSRVALPLRRACISSRLRFVALKRCRACALCSRVARFASPLACVVRRTFSHAILYSYCSLEPQHADST